MRCLHHSSSAVHLIVGSDQVVSLVDRIERASPVAMVLPELFASGAAAFLAGESRPAEALLLMGNLRAESERAAVWKARPAWPVLGPAGLARLAQEVERATAGGAGVVDAALVERLASALVDRRADDASGATSRSQAVAAAAMRLIGRGAGLTPAGDDAIVGALHALWCVAPEDFASQRGREVAVGLDGRTSALSRAWLLAAVEGEAVAPWHSVMLAAASEETARLGEALAGVAAIGASSGRAMLAGFGAVLRCAEQLAQPGG